MVAFPGIMNSMQLATASSANDLVQSLAILLLAAGLSGWLFQKIGLSSVVGYILAGIVIGPNSFGTTLIDDQERIDALAQIGLVFLMFWIGLGFSIRRARRVGLKLILANIIAGLVLFLAFYSVSKALGWNQDISIFIGAMFMISSSAIICKLLGEKGISHERSAQYALGVVINEDAMVVILMTLLASYIQFSSVEVGSVLSVVGTLLLFLTLILLLGLVFIPRILAFFETRLDRELFTNLMIALVFVFAIVAVRAGYPLALGSFILGAIVADTSAKRQIERLLGGSTYVLGAIFFCAIGMMIEVEVLLESWKLILLFSFLTLALRCMAYSTGLMVSGVKMNEAIRTGLLVTPVGEFSFVMAEIGLKGGKLTSEFYALAVGVSLVTAVVAPFIFKHSDGMSVWMQNRSPKFWRRFLSAYHESLEKIGQLRSQSKIWQLSKKRIFQIMREVLSVSAILVFSRPLLSLIEEKFGEHILLVHGTPVIFWTCIIALVSAPLFALWRNIDALTMIYSEMLFSKKETLSRRRMVENTMKMICLGVTIIWLWAILPIPTFSMESILVLAFFGIAWFLFFRSRLIFWHSKLEYALKEAIAPDSLDHTEKLPRLLDEHESWGLEILEVEIPERTRLAGKSLEDLHIRRNFNVTVIGIERQGFLIGNPRQDTRLYPNDRLLLLGKAEAVGEARDYLKKRRVTEISKANFEDMILEHVTIDEKSSWCRAKLADLALPRKFGVQIVGLARGEEMIKKLSGEQILLPGDELLVIGAPSEISELNRWMLEDAKAKV